MTDKKSIKVVDTQVQEPKSTKDVETRVDKSQSNKVVDTQVQELKYTKDVETRVDKSQSNKGTNTQVKESVVNSPLIEMHNILNNSEVSKQLNDIQLNDIRVKDKKLLEVLKMNAIAEYTKPDYINMVQNECKHLKEKDNCFEHGCKVINNKCKSTPNQLVGVHSKHICSDLKKYTENCKLNLDTNAQHMFDSELKKEVIHKLKKLIGNEDSNVNKNSNVHKKIERLIDILNTNYCEPKKEFFSSRENKCVPITLENICSQENIDKFKKDKVYDGDKCIPRVQCDDDNSKYIVDDKCLDKTYYINQLNNIDGISDEKRLEYQKTIISSELNERKSKFTNIVKNECKKQDKVHHDGNCITKEECAKTENMYISENECLNNSYYADKAYQISGEDAYYDEIMELPENERKSKFIQMQKEHCMSKENHVIHGDECIHREQCRPEDNKYIDNNECLNYKYDKIENIDYPGNDLPDNNQNINSVHDCKIKCNNNPKCKLFAYEKDKKRCWLKDRMGDEDMGDEDMGKKNRNPNQNVDTYISRGDHCELQNKVYNEETKQCFSNYIKETNVDFPGNYIENNHFENTTLAVCKEKCDQLDECKLFTYGGQTGLYKNQCWLKNKIEISKRTANSRVSSYINKTRVPNVLDYIHSETLQGENDTNYRGFQNKTIQGKKCQSWSSQSPHSHGNTPEQKPKKGLDSNYCRNPDGESTIWCYTTHLNTPRWDICLPKNIQKKVNYCDLVHNKLYDIETKKCIPPSQCTGTKTPYIDKLTKPTKLCVPTNSARYKTS